MEFKLFKNGNEVEVYHIDVGYDNLIGRLKINPGGTLSILLEPRVRVLSAGARSLAEFLDEWESNPTIREILETEE